MKQKTAAIKFLRTKIAAGYVLILILIFSIVYIWFKEHHKLEEMKEASHKISCLRQNIHDIYVRAVDLSLIGETILNWDDEDIELYHTKRLEVDTLLYQFSSVYPSKCIDSICLLLAEKEKLLHGIMQVLNEQEEIEEKIAKQVPVIARKSTREKPQKRKRTGFLGLFGKKEEAKPTATTTTFRFFQRYMEKQTGISLLVKIESSYLNCRSSAVRPHLGARIDASFTKSYE